ncbi:unnamed protein product [Discosporangium mesarthrocarpum]
MFTMGQTAATSTTVQAVARPRGAADTAQSESLSEHSSDDLQSDTQPMWDDTPSHDGGQQQIHRGEFSGRLPRSAPQPDSSTSKWVSGGVVTMAEGGVRTDKDLRGGSPPWGPINETSYGKDEHGYDKDELSDDEEECDESQLRVDISLHSDMPASHPYHHTCCHDGLGGGESWGAGDRLGLDREETTEVKRGGGGGEQLDPFIQGGVSPVWPGSSRDNGNFEEDELTDSEEEEKGKRVGREEWRGSRDKHCKDKRSFSSADTERGHDGNNFSCRSETGNRGEREGGEEGVHEDQRRAEGDSLIRLASAAASVMSKATEGLSPGQTCTTGGDPVRIFEGIEQLRRDNDRRNGSNRSSAVGPDVT